MEAGQCVCVGRGGVTRRKIKNQRPKETVIRGSLPVTAAAAVFDGSGAVLSASIQQLVPNPLGRNASPNPLLSGRLQPAHRGTPLAVCYPLCSRAAATYK